MMKRRYVWLLVAVVLCLSFVFLSPSEILRSLVALDGPLLAAVVVGLYFCRALILLPPSFITVFVGFKYGYTVGIPIAVTGIALTTLPVYYAGRRSTTDGSLFGLDVERAERLSTTIGGVRGVAAVNLTPVPADIVAYAAGIAQVPPKSFVPGFLLGTVPYTLAFVSIGASLQSLNFETATLSAQEDRHPSGESNDARMNDVDTDSITSDTREQGVFACALRSESEQ